MTYQSTQVKPGARTINIITNDVGNTVRVSMKYAFSREDEIGHSAGSVVGYKWSMRLQRYVGTSGRGGYWNTISDPIRRGYINQQSPSNRTFSGMGYHGSYVRVQIKFYPGIYWQGSLWDSGDPVWATSRTWIR